MKKKYNMAIFFLCAALFLSFIPPLLVNAAEVFFTYAAMRAPSRGVTYERKIQMTSVGLRDVHILRVPLDDPYIHVAPVAAQPDVGLRRTTTGLLGDAGAVAGVNASFFDLTLQYAVGHTTSVYNGAILSANAYVNRNTPAFATFFTDFYNRPFFDYLRISMYLYVNNRRDFPLHFINNIGTQMTEAHVFTTAAMACTAAIDERFPNTAKLVSDGNYIIHIAPPGETVRIPEGGFVIVFPATRAYRAYNYTVGDFP